MRKAWSSTSLCIRGEFLSLRPISVSPDIEAIQVPSANTGYETLRKPVQLYRLDRKSVTAQKYGTAFRGVARANGCWSLESFLLTSSSAEVETTDRWGWLRPTYGHAFSFGFPVCCRSRNRTSVIRHHYIVRLII